MFKSIPEDAPKEEIVENKPEKKLKIDPGENQEKPKTRTFLGKQTPTQKLFGFYLVNCVSCLHDNYQGFTFDYTNNLSLDLSTHSEQNEVKYSEEHAEDLEKAIETLENRIKTFKIEGLKIGKIHLSEIDTELHFDPERVPEYTKGVDAFYTAVGYFKKPEIVKNSQNHEIRENGFHKPDNLLNAHDLMQITTGPGQRPKRSPVRRSMAELGNPYARYGLATNLTSGRYSRPSNGYLSRSRHNSSFGESSTPTVTLEKLLKNYFRSNLLDNVNSGFKCEICRRTVDMSSSLRFSTLTYRLYDLPQSLVITLKRFKPNRWGIGGFSSYVKNNCRVEFPEELDLTPYCICKPNNKQFSQNFDIF